MINHILLEIFCMKDADFNAEKPLPDYCAAKDNPSYECLRMKCPFLDFTYCENTLCYTNEKAEMEAGILFGGDMEAEGENEQNLNIWKRICVDAVNESYEKYMRRKRDE